MVNDGGDGGEGGGGGDHVGGQTEDHSRGGGDNGGNPG